MPDPETAQAADTVAHVPKAPRRLRAAGAVIRDVLNHEQFNFATGNGRTLGPGSGASRSGRNR